MQQAWWGQQPGRSKGMFRQFVQLGWFLRGEEGESHFLGLHIVCGHRRWGGSMDVVYLVSWLEADAGICGALM